MKEIIVRGGYPLHGQIAIGGSKNATLPMLAASLLCQGETILEGCPRIQDVESMRKLLCHVGCKVNCVGHTLHIGADEIRCTELKEEAVKEVRASVLFLGSLLSRFGKVSITYPGGCSIGKRPIDYHLSAFEKMGAKVSLTETTVLVEAKELQGAKISLPFPSVGATENILLAAVRAKGVTWIENAAREPEIVELCMFLRAMGAQIHGEGSSHIIISGVDKLEAVNYEVPYDRIVLATYGFIVAGTGGELTLTTNGSREITDLEILTRIGCQVFYNKGSVIVTSKKRPKPISYIVTRPYPGFSTDMQSQLLATMCVAGGESMVEESVFENRFGAAKEMQKMGARIVIKGQRCYVYGVEHLQGAKVKIPDLRGGAALLEAALMAEGESVLSRAEILERGYENLIDNIQSVGGEIELSS